MARLDGKRDDPWAKYHCFELDFKNPYQSKIARASYRPFDFEAKKKPVCTAVNADGTPNPDVAVNCRLRRHFTLQFWFEELKKKEFKTAVQQIRITNFVTPHSA